MFRIRSMPRGAGRSLAMILALAIITGCNATAVPIPPPTAAPLPVAAPPASESVAISIVEPSSNTTQWKFDPNTVMVRTGDAIVWTNTGGAAHTATATDGAFNSGDLPAPFRSRAGGAFSWTATAAGTFAYICTYHPWMTGTITVTAS